jgi:hypothetical protein
MRALSPLAAAVLPSSPSPRRHAEDEPKPPEEAEAGGTTRGEARRRERAGKPKTDDTDIFKDST